MGNSIFAIAAGSFTDFFGSLLVYVLVGGLVARTGWPPDVQVAAMLTLGLAMDVLGGFVTGVIARRHKVQHAIITGVVLFMLTVVPALLQTAAPHALDYLGFLLLVPCETLGGILATRLPPRKTGTPQDPPPPIARPF